MTRESDANWYPREILSLLVLLWLVLPVEQASHVSAMMVISALLLFSAYMFLLWRRVRHLPGEQRGI